METELIEEITLSVYKRYNNINLRFLQIFQSIALNIKQFGRSVLAHFLYNLEFEGTV